MENQVVFQLDFGVGGYGYSDWVDSKGLALRGAQGIVIEYIRSLPPDGDQNIWGLSYTDSFPCCQ